MLQNCVLPIQCTRESFRMFLAYPHTRPRLMARVITHAMFTSSLCYASCHHDVMYHAIMMLCIISCIYETQATSSSSHCLTSLYFFFFLFFVIITYSLPYHDSYQRSDVTSLPHLGERFAPNLISYGDTTLHDVPKIPSISPGNALDF
jgi:hypothetical protein